MTTLPSPMVVPHLSLARIIGLHLAPGILTTVAYVILAPVVIAWGWPTVLALLLAALLVLIPVELGLLYQAAKVNGNLSWQEIISYREPIPIWQYIVLPGLLVVWGFLISGLIAPFETFISQALFAWLPSWLFISSPDQLALYPRSVLWTTFVIGLIVNGLAGPIVEELYFRGYLLPRLAQFGRLAPLLNVVLFSLYHFWTPWQNLSRILLLTPLVYVVWWKRNILVGIIAHCTINLIGWTLTFALSLGSTP
jgi:uncharacterized protein